MADEAKPITEESMQAAMRALSGQQLGPGQQVRTVEQPDPGVLALQETRRVAEREREAVLKLKPHLQLAQLRVTDAQVNLLCWGLGAAAIGTIVGGAVAILSERG